MILIWRSTEKTEREMRIERWHLPEMLLAITADCTQVEQRATVQMA